MENNTKFVLKEFLRFIYYSCITVVLLLFMFGITHFDMANFDNIPECSLTEILQEILLLFCVSIFSCLARKFGKNGLWLVAGFLCCMLIRELDIVFDMIFHGAWKFIAVPAAIFFIFLAFGTGIQQAVIDLTHFMKKRNYPFFFLGLILILIVSRILGSLELVRLIAADDETYQYMIKNFMEESCELIGYLILFLSSCCYYYDYRKESKKNNMQ